MYKSHSVPGAREDGPVSRRLQKAKVPVVSDSKCKDVMRSQPGAFNIHSSMICAGHTDGSADSCQGGLDILTDITHRY